MTEIVTMQIDGKEVRARTDQTILQAAEASGVYIPRLCHREGLHPYGGCRVCMVRVNGRPAASCTEPVTPGAVVESETEEIRGWRRAVIEMLFVEGNHLCPICEVSGRCELQALAYRLGSPGPRYPYLWRRRETDATHPDVLIERERCILCARCVRTSRDVDGKSAFGFTGRGPDKELAVSAAEGLGGTSLEATDEAVDACPVGSILRKGRAYDTPIGERPFDRTPIGERTGKARPGAGPGEML